eukprot:CAMPEP_0114620798 /NCGR_PEP_ID=MMETSP0168-20121206/8908_1 /TAXON_ID=95228 ORGANISM="Vannella sp., Strain DIVA3 517/6/12" /NCGR_SAMPLE_ID=MMETSP0168 /ASSEMBLY_ACC=CAM_ASM_000044 /LENGTH=412 /DNA_ID=CAMNT_0001831995 /DNA_START=31 /DNA_END=1265 /DNA_ORIENTATION=-
MPIRRGRTVHLTPEQARRSDQCNAMLLQFLAVLFLVAAPLCLCWAEWEQHEMHMAFEEAAERAVSVRPEAPVSAMNSGGLVHVATSDIRVEETLSDNDFGITAPQGTVKLARKNEYCQWVEHVTEKKNRNGEKVRSYWYTKGWRSHPVPSVFFSQPFRHHNPLRQPFSDGLLQAQEVRLASYTVGPRLVDSLPVSAPLQLESSAAAAVEQSMAAREHGFRYVGDGYFYSPYEESAAGWWAKLAGQFLEGSLLDIQLTDLFDQCTPGDVRTHFKVATPTSLTALGRQLDGEGHIGAWLSAREYEVALLREGIRTTEDMLEEVKSEHRYLVLLFRAVAIGWMYLLLGKLGVEEHSLVRFAASVAGTAGIMGALWLVTWGISPLSLMMTTFLAAVAVVIRREADRATEPPYVPTA